MQATCSCIPCQLTLCNLHIKFSRIHLAPDGDSAAVKLVLKIQGTESTSHGLVQIRHAGQCRL